MMGRKARRFTPVPAVSLDELVPADHFYRHLDRVLDQVVAMDELCTQAGHVELGGHLQIVQGLWERRRSFPGCHCAGQRRGLRCQHVRSS